MSDNWKIDLMRREKLETAWEYYSDLIVPGHNYRDELRKLRQGERSETPEETKKRIKLLHQREDSLKRQFLSFIPDGFFYVFGCELSSATATHDPTPINHTLFDQNLSGSKITWEQNSLEVLGRTFIGLEFRPNIEVIQDAWSGHDFSQDVEGLQNPEPRQLPSAVEEVELKEPTTPKKKKGGRPKTQDVVKAKIREMIGTQVLDKLPNRWDQAIEVRVRLKGEETRDHHGMAGYKTDVIARWIGEVANEETPPSE
ncbi:hypothetical protein [Hyphomonas sp. GM-8P]|uniref:hypothetical protein n=1 Tax=Hyphomonas sp. GM-8P TaxID=1280945 RepID=UPI0011BFB1ED|nr:hypothetical protein [Hyphomonas sp. GM-8P]